MAKITPYLIPVLFFSILLLGSYYVGRRFIWSLGHGKVIYSFLAFLLLALFSFFGLFITVNKVDSFSHIIYVLAAFSMGFILYYFITTILVDLIHLFIKFKPEYFNYATISLALLLCMYGYFHSKNIHVTHKTIPIAGLTKNIKAVHLTDIHIGHFRDNPNYLDKIIDITNSENPDVIFFTGDYLDAARALDEVHFKPLTRLEAPLFFVEGNHDVSTNAPAILAKARQQGVYVLENQMVDWNDLQIIGLNHMVADSNSYSPHTSADRSTIKNVLNKLSPNKEKPSILLHHSPDGIEYANEHGVDLYLAGHTHGGQLWPITIIAEYIFAYNKGLDNYKETAIYVTQGTGTFGPPMRVGTNAEIAVLNLIPMK